MLNREVDLYYAPLLLIFCACMAQWTGTHWFYGVMVGTVVTGVLFTWPIRKD